MDFVHVQPVREDDELFRGVFATGLPPLDRGLGPFGGIARVDADARPLGEPIGGVVEKAFGPVGVGQDDAEVAVVFLVPIGEHVIGRAAEVLVGLGEGGVDHGKLVGVGADGFDVALHGDFAVRGADEFIAEAFDEGLNAPVLPEEAVAAAGAEVREFQVGDRAEGFHLFPEFRHAARVEHFEFEFTHGVEDRAGAELHQDGERGDFPEHDLGPGAFEGEFVLAVVFFEVVGGQAEVLEPLHKVRAEHLAFAVEGIAAQPSGFPTGQRQGPHVVELFAQFAFVDHVGKADVFGAVDQAKGHAGVAFVAEHRLTHQQFVKVRIDERPHDGVDLPFVVIDASCEIDHDTGPFGLR